MRGFPFVSGVNTILLTRKTTAQLEWTPIAQNVDVRCLQKLNVFHAAVR